MNHSRQEVLDLLEDVVRSRKYQPKLLQEMQVKTTLGILNKIKFDEQQKSPDIPDLPSSSHIIQNLNIFDEGFKDEIVERLRVLRILCAKKNCRINKILNDS